ncbi:MAG: penicillin-binding protein 2, partial [Treponema sp.]|nr:penicillin-binding protein 2 [Treponema sp.]
SFAVEVTPDDIPSEYYDTVISKLAAFLGVPRTQIDERLPVHTKNSHYYGQSYEVKTNVSLKLISSIAENITDLPGVSWKNKPIRKYVETGSLSHVIGYVGNIEQKELEVRYNKGYTKQSIIGKTGIELEYDEYLQGKNGREIRTIDAEGRVISSTSSIEPPQSGNNLILTIDSSIQRLAEEALGERVGAAVVLRPYDGEILAMASYPFYDANIFSTDSSRKEYVKLINTPNEPMLNRAVDALYPPASTFKTIMCTALLNEKVFPPENTVLCTGKMTYGNRTSNCHKKSGHGKLDMKHALSESCDVYFWKTGRDFLGVDKISEYASMFGLGEDLGIDLPSAKKGLVPTAAYKERRIHQKWLGGDTMNMSIGQGYTTVTPLHVANMMAMVCNSGTIYRPHILKEIQTASGETVKKTEREILHKSDVSPDVWKKVQDYLRYTITSGTPQYPMMNKTVALAGKTGTGEDNRLKPGHWHSWMVAYGPYDAPVENQIVVVVLVEGVNEWEWWAPYATNIIMQGYFNEQTYQEAKDALGFHNIEHYLRSAGRQE